MYTRPHPSPVGGSSYCGVAQSIRAVAAARLELNPPLPSLQVVPRTATWLNQSEQWLQPALNFLQDRIQIR